METKRIALLGQPNSGKSTIFNTLTGMHQHVGNWPGKTVEKKEGTFTRGGGSGSAGFLFSVGKFRGGDHYKGLYREKRPGSGMYPCGWLSTGKKPVYAGGLCGNKNPCHAGGYNDGCGKGTGKGNQYRQTF